MAVTRGALQTRGSRSSSAWLEVFEKERVPAAVINWLDEALAHPVVRSREMVEDVARPRGGSVQMLGSPFKFSGQTPLSYPPR